MTHPSYVATLCHITPDGDEHVLAEGESKTRSLRVLRAAMKQLGRQSGVSFHLFVLKRTRAPLPFKPANEHYFRCMEGKGRRHRRACR